MTKRGYDEDVYAAVPHGGGVERELLVELGGRPEQ
jgi:hypothetical protein